MSNAIVEIKVGASTRTLADVSVLVFMKGYLGDAIMATPLLHGLARHGCRVHALTQPPVMDLLRDSFPSVRFHLMRRLSHPLELWRQARELRSLQVNAALVVNRSFRSALATRLAGIPFRVGHRTEGRSWLLSRAVEYDEEKNEALCYLDLARSAGIEITDSHPKLCVTQEARDLGLRRLQGATVGVQPGARHKDKQIPIETLAAVVRALQADGHAVAMFGGPDERAHGAELSNHVAQPIVDLIGQSALRETPGLLANLRLMIGSDTGLMHIAAASGCPTLTCFGPTRASKWAHTEQPHRHIAAPDENIRTISSEQIIGVAREMQARS